MIQSRYGRRIFLPFLFFLLIFLTACDRQHHDVWLPAWFEAAPLTTPRAGASAVAYKNFIYVIGGVDGRNFLSSIERTEITDDGALTSWKIVSSMPQPRGFFDAIVVDDYLYIFGGGNGENGKNLLRSVYRAMLFDDGSIGEWEAQSELLLPRRCVKVFENNGRVYALGGFGGALLDSVEYAELNREGDLSAWKMSEQKMTLPRYVNAVKKSDDQVFVIGGHHQEKGIGIEQVETASLKNMTLTWKQNSGSLSEGRYGLSSAANGDYIYALGGLSGLEYLASIEVFSKTDGEWRQTTALPNAMANFSTVKYKKNLYILGGTTRGKYLDAVHFSQFDEKGDLGIYVTKKQADIFSKKERSISSQDSNSTVRSSAKSTMSKAYARQASVEEVILTDQYTYVMVNEKGNRFWIAGPVVELKKGDFVGFSEGVKMSNFYSKSLQQKFDEILFVGQLVFIK